MIVWNLDTLPMVNFILVCNQSQIAFFKPKIYILRFRKKQKNNFSTTETTLKKFFSLEFHLERRKIQIIIYLSKQFGQVAKHMAQCKEIHGPWNHRTIVGDRKEAGNKNIVHYLYDCQNISALFTRLNTIQKMSKEMSVIKIWRNIGFRSMSRR